jgi:transcriptional regulator with XRE-family HTH domain
MAGTVTDINAAACALAAALTKQARQNLGLTLDEMADMLGYEGEHRRQMMHRVEIGERRLREPQRRLIDAYLHGYRPIDWPR